ncbi:MAG: right-handed parallel beta-helix repeat-containing protein [Bacteroidia bacterium]
MILRHTHQKTQSRPIVWVISGLALLLVSLGFVFSLTKESPGLPAEIPSGAFCDLESTTATEEGEMLANGTAIFQGIATRSDEYARSGRFSSRQGGAEAYGLAYYFSDAKPGDRYKASVWRYGPKLSFSYLTVSITGEADQQYYRQEEVAIETDENEWEKLSFIFQVPDWYQGQLIKVYPYTATGDGIFVYFDDLSVEKISRDELRAHAMDADTSSLSLELRISEKGMDKLEGKRREALRKGILFSTDADWVKAEIPGNPATPVSLRLKGDWMDHLKTDKWSLRIKVKNPHAWNRLITFSIQHPKTRDYLTEWVYHQFLTREDILTPRYDFIHVKINETHKGVYALEEHFEKQLPEFRERREGPLVKFSEDGVWNARKRGLDRREITGHVEETLNSFEASHVETFKEKKTLASPVLSAQYDQARALMDQYRFGEKSCSEIFDTDRLATYYAITDICRGYHSMFWHNQRFYFNPIISKLEPVGYDAFTEEGGFEFSSHPFLGAEISTLSGDPGEDLIFRPFMDTAFVARYIRALDRLSDPLYLENFFLDLAPGIAAREKLLQTDFPDYVFESKIHDFGKNIRSTLYPLDNNSVRAFTSKDGELKITSYHILPLEIMGFGKMEAEVNNLLDKPQWLIPHNPHQPPVFTEMATPENARFVFFRLPGLKKLYVSRIVPWQPSATEIPAQAIQPEEPLASCELYDVEGNVVRFHIGTFTVDRNVIIPAGYKVEMTGNTQLDFRNQARFISYSPIRLIGTEDEPVRIFSSDKTARGFTVLQAGEPSLLRYVSFEGFNTLEDQGWSLTGAVTFYESDVNIEHCAFLDALCEDALNLVRSRFQLTESVIRGGPSDGLDADFCKGMIRNTSIGDMGNDGLDISGSVVDIYYCMIDGVGDKGISVGEASTLIVHGAEIRNAVKGVVAKDLSSATILNIKLFDCYTGFSAYQKKPEYGGATISVENYTAQRVKLNSLVERVLRLR